MKLFEQISRRTWFLILCDVIAIVTSLVIANYLWCGSWEMVLAKIPHVYFSLAVFLTLFYVFDLYYPYKYFGPAQTLTDVVMSVGIGMIVAAALAYMNRSFAMPRYTFVYAALCLCALIFFIRLVYDIIFKSRLAVKNALIVGSGAMALELDKRIQATPYAPMRVVGMVAQKMEDSGNRNEAKHALPVLGEMAELISLIDRYDVQLVILGETFEGHISDVRMMDRVLQKKIMITSATYLYERLTGETPHRHLSPNYLMGLMSQVRGRAYLKVKRLMDLCFGLLLLVFLSPILLIAGALLLLTGTSDIFFLQTRIGKNGIPFRVIKLRSMTESQKGIPQVTKLGSLLRKYRIDEIPQLLNVLKGEMSLIGPRPEIPYFANRCRRKIPFYDLIFALSPGITGWAQVKFRYTTSVKDYERKFQFNLYYIKNVSFPLDLLIILKTIRVVLLGKGL
jgi:exopolysaccharide biosynthesis polyprenyl glycosylphosphotransferase